LFKKAVILPGENPQNSWNPQQDALISLNMSSKHPGRLLILLALWAIACNPARQAATRDDGQIEIVFLQLNDVYEIAPLGDNTGGLARVAALRQELLSKNPNTITVLAGDFISPSVTGSLRYEGRRIRGRQMVETLNALGLDWVVFGNHEFDYNLEDLQARLDESNFTWLGANARLKTDDQLQPFFKNRPTGKAPCPDNLVVSLTDADGTSLRLGAFGILIDSGRKPWVAYSNPDSIARVQVAMLKDRADLVVGLTHRNFDEDLALAAALPEVPLWMGGHDHDHRIEKVGAATVAKADANARTVYIHTLRYNKKTRQTSLQSELRRIDAKLPEEPQTAAVVARWERIKNNALLEDGIRADQKLVELKEPLDCRESAVRHRQLPVGRLITGAMLAASKPPADCAILNSGSIRVDDVLSGWITEVDVVRMLPFGGPFIEADMRGDFLKRVLDAGRGNKGSGGYLQLNGAQWDETRQGWLIGAEALDPQRVYRVALPNFLLTGDEKNMDFLKTTVNPDGTGTSNPGILKLYGPAPGDKADLRNDIRRALIEYWRRQ
jgi:2',3'-cyclic-nucleotide 2'-phosphodiesterase (5'-nucleotidase family)